MAQRTEPPFRADQVGSLLRPPELKAARERHKQGEIGAAELGELEDDAIRTAVRRQEEIGLAAVTDGEFRRTWWHLDFLSGFKNVRLIPPIMKARFHTAAGNIEAAPPPGLRVEGRLSRDKPIFVDHFAFLQSVARAVPKQTIPSPTQMHFRGGRKAIDGQAYPEIDGFFADLARVYAEEIAALGAAGCRYLQLDEVNFAYLCDPEVRAQVRAIGEDPDALPAIYARLINAALKGRPPGMRVTMHLCRGNFQSAWVAAGGYEPVAEILFNQVGVDAYFMEYDSDRAGGFEPLRLVPKDKVVVLGLVTTKTGALEAKDALKRRIEQATRFIDLDRLCLSPQCGFASTEEGNAVSADEQWRKLGLVVEVAREVWGG